jgi:uncharacterized membrane protein
MASLHTTLAILVACLLGGASLVLTWRRLDPMAPNRRALLLALRGCAFGCLMLMLADPVSTWTEPGKAEPRAAVLIDRSASMGMKDAPGGKTRLDWALDSLRPGGPVEAVVSNAEASRWLFADTTAPARKLGAAEASGQATDIGSALTAALGHASAEPPDAVLLISDGAANRGLSGDALAVWAERRRVPVYCVGVGGQAQPPDAWVGSVDAPREVRAGQAATVTATLGARGFEEQRVGVGLDVRGVASQQREVVLAPGARPRVEFSIRPPEPGLYHCELRLGAVPGEWTEANNSRSFFLRVVPGVSRLLLVAGRPSREFKFVRRALDNAPDLRVTYLVRQSGQSFWQIGDQPQKGRRLPASEALDEYDAVVLCDVPSAAFSAGEVQRLVEFVRTRGGGLGMVGGWDSYGAGGYGASALAPALGVRVSGPSDFSAVPVKAQTTSLGSSTAPIEDIERHEDFPGWSALPLVAGSNEVSAAKPGASSLLVTQSGQPLLVIQRYARGRTLCWMGAGTHRWVLSKDATVASREGHAVFWTGIATWLTTPPNRAPVALQTDRDVYESGDTARVIVQVSDRGFRPASGAKVVVQVTGPKGESRQVTLAEVAGAAGRYEAGLTVAQPGTYGLEARAAVGGAELGRAKLQIVAEAPRRELADPAQNVGLLKAVADASGGAYLAAEDVARLPQVVRLVPRAEAVSRQRHWARSAFGLLGFLALAGVDWFLRRWWGVG